MSEVLLKIKLLWDNAQFPM